MSSERPPAVWPNRSVHVEWGRPALDQAAAAGDGIVIVDVLSFSTLVALVTARGAAVRALAPPDIAELGGRDAVAARFSALVAGERRGDTDARVTLSPSSAVRVQAGDRLVVPLLNGGMLTARAESAAFTVVGCFRNAVAVGEFVASALRLGLVDRVTIVPAGEQWKDDWTGTERARFAIEDWLGAGAIVDALLATLGAGALSAEATLAAQAFATTREPGSGAGLEATVVESVSGRELVERGYAADVALAVELGADPGVPRLRGDGFIERLPFTLRPATEGDGAFLFDLKHATMHRYLSETFGAWDAETERDRFRPDLARTAVVSVDGVDVAMVEARVEPDGLYLANLQVAQAHQSRGLGAAIVGLLASTAHARGRSLGLRVLKVNTRALAFYERLGFVVTGTVEPQWTMTLPAP